MQEKSEYKTRQRSEIRAYLESRQGSHVTAAEIKSHFESLGIPIGLTTIYRTLDHLVRSGEVRRFTIEGTPAACYGYIGKETEVPGEYHLKCEECGRLIHVRCDQIEELTEHMLEGHHFHLDPLQTVFYGTCEECMAKKAKKKKEDGR
ncbi:MAG: Fur family transcriptional regulator [Anaerovoracaceae bacterium]|jgi:Fur family ferric uptake transcriptional regulator